MNKQIDGSDCPLGEDCPIHYRIDEVKLYDHLQQGRMITYVGAYCVVTDQIFSTIAMFGIGPRYSTDVFCVGEEGAFCVVNDADVDEQYDRLRYRHDFYDWSDFRTDHEFAVLGVREGTLDVSKPWMDQ